MTSVLVRAVDWKLCLGSGLVFAQGKPSQVDCAGGLKGDDGRLIAFTHYINLLLCGCSLRFAQRFNNHLHQLKHARLRLGEWMNSEKQIERGDWGVPLDSMRLLLRLFARSTLPSSQATLFELNNKRDIGVMNVGGRVPNVSRPSLRLIARRSSMWKLIVPMWPGKCKSSMCTPIEVWDG